jgi:hypothetical protein
MCYSIPISESKLCTQKRPATKGQLVRRPLFVVSPVTDWDRFQNPFLRKDDGSVSHQAQVGTSGGQNRGGVLGLNDDSWKQDTIFQFLFISTFWKLLRKFSLSLNLEIPSGDQDRLTAPESVSDHS